AARKCSGPRAPVPPGVLAESSLRSRPTTRPGEAATPRIRRSAIAAGLCGLLVESALGQSPDLVYHRLCAVSGYPHMEAISRSRPETHELHRALGIDPWPVSGKRDLDRTVVSLGKLSELDRRPRMQP